MAKWTSAIAGIEELAMHEWSEVLAGMRPDQIAHALHNMDSEWPPNAVEFKKLCRQTKGHPSYQEFDPTKALPNLPADHEFVESHLDKMRGAINGKA